MKRRGQQPPSLSGQQLPSSSGLTAVEKPGTTISLPRTVHLSVQNCAHGGAPNLASRASAQQKSVKFWKRFLQGRAPLALGCARRRRYFWRKWTPWTPSAPPAAKRHGQQTSSSITRTWSARSGIVRGVQILSMRRCKRHHCPELDHEVLLKKNRYCHQQQQSFIIITTITYEVPFQGFPSTCSLQVARVLWLISVPRFESAAAPVANATAASATRAAPTPSAG